MKNKTIQLAAALLLLFVVQPVFAEELPDGVNSPKAEMQSTLDSLVEVVQSHPGEEQLEDRRSKMREVIEPRFDFEEMSKRSLGAEWKSLSEPQRNEFVDLFSELLARTYLGRIENVEPGMVEIQDQKIRYPRALVRTSVDYKGDTFPIDYKLVNRGGGWQVYDVIIENIGLISNYRNEFAGIIRKEKFAGLLERLRAKNS